MNKFRYLKMSLALALLMLGIKMSAATWLKEVFGTSFNFVLLGVVLLIRVVGIAASMIVGQRDQIEVGSVREE